MFTRFRTRLKSLLSRDRLECDLEDELAFHLALKAEKSYGQAEARRRFRNAGLVRG